MKSVFKLLIISVLCVFIFGCKSKLNTSTTENTEVTTNTDDLRDEQMNDYEEEIRQQNNN